MLDIQFMDNTLKVDNSKESRSNSSARYEPESNDINSKIRTQLKYDTINNFILSAPVSGEREPRINL